MLFGPSLLTTPHSIVAHAHTAVEYCVRPNRSIAYPAFHPSMFSTRRERHAMGGGWWLMPRVVTPRPTDEGRPWHDGMTPEFVASRMPHASTPANATVVQAIANSAQKTFPIIIFLLFQSRSSRLFDVSVDADSLRDGRQWHHQMQLSRCCSSA